jgi:hypothetical protein
MLDIGVKCMQYSRHGVSKCPRTHPYLGVGCTGSHDISPPTQHLRTEPENAGYDWPPPITDGSVDLLGTLQHAPVVGHTRAHARTAPCQERGRRTTQQPEPAEYHRIERKCWIGSLGSGLERSMVVLTVHAALQVPLDGRLPLHARHD